VEHIRCLRGPDKLDNVLYDALSNSCSKALLYVCTKCQAKGSLSQRLFKFELENAQLCDERLASVQLQRETTIVLEKLRAESEEEKARLQEELHDLKHHLTDPEGCECL